MNFNSDTSKQVQQAILSRKVKVTPRPQLVFNSNPVHENSSWNDEKASWNVHRFQAKFSRAFWEHAQ